MYATFTIEAIVFNRIRVRSAETQIINSNA